MPHLARLVRNLLPFFLLTAVLTTLASASGPYKIGSGNTVTADPLVTRPSTTPCVVTLFTDAAFYDFNVENFSFTPPADCPGPWAKVVLESDINLNAGIQYDRTANYLAGARQHLFRHHGRAFARTSGHRGTSRTISPTTVPSSTPRSPARQISATRSSAAASPRPSTLHGHARVLSTWHQARPRAVVARPRRVRAIRRSRKEEPLR
jgi:hypothetical protein